MKIYFIASIHSKNEKPFSVYNGVKQQRVESFIYLISMQESFTTGRWIPNYSSTSLSLTVMFFTENFSSMFLFSLNHQVKTYVQTFVMLKSIETKFSRLDESLLGGCGYFKRCRVPIVSCHINCILLPVIFFSFVDFFICCRFDKN